MIQNFTTPFGDFMMFSINMTNCNTSLLHLYVDSCDRYYQPNVFFVVTIKNCTLGCWTFNCIIYILIKDCGIKGSPSCGTKLIMDIKLSFALLENISIHSVNIECTAYQFCGFVILTHSRVTIKHLSYEKNKSPLMVQEASHLLIENCTLLDSGGRNSVIYGAVGAIIDIMNCRIENNTAPEHVGIVFAEHMSHVRITGSTFTGNQGSGVAVTTSSILEVSNSTFKNNSAPAGGGIIARVHSTLTIYGSIFDSNTASKAGGSIFIDESKEDSFAICKSSTFINNRAENSGGAIAVRRSNVTMSNLIINQNHGGGALSLVKNFLLDIHNCTFTKNADGGILATGNNSLIVRNCNFFNNEARNGGAISVEKSKNVTLSHVRLFQNVASINGGAITSYSVNLHIDSSIFEGNAASSDDVSVRKTSLNIPVNTNDFSSGGALYINSGSLFMSNSIAKHNRAVNGGVIQGIRSDINLTSCLFENNTVDFDAGAVSITNSSLGTDRVTYTKTRGGAIHADQCKVYVSNSLFSKNIASAGSGGSIAVSGDVLQILNTKFSANYAHRASVLHANNVTEIQLIDCVFIYNEAFDGGVVIVNGSSFLVKNSIFEGNINIEFSDRSCLTLSDSQASVENCTFKRNMNNSQVGAITSKHCEFRISMSIFDSNEALNGTDIFLENGLLIYSSIFKHSMTLKSSDRNFKQKAFGGNILRSDYSNNVTITESQYASGRKLLHFVFP